MGRSTVRHLVAAGVIVTLGSLAACGAGSGDSGSADTGSTSSGGRAVAEPAPDEAASADHKSAPGANRTVVRARSVVTTGEVALTSKNLERVRAEVDALVTALGGSVDNEQTANDRHGKVERSTLVLRVPVDKFTVAKKSLMRMGKLKTSHVSSKDVTTQVIDIDERVQTLQASLDNLQTYQRGAKDVKDLLDYEEKITARQSELQSLQAQQAYLADQTSMATITLYLSVPDKYVPPPDLLEDAGFLAGLRAGWHALVDVGVVGLTVLGAMLPFLLAGSLLGVPLWIGLRALLRRRRTTLPPAPVES